MWKFWITRLPPYLFQIFSPGKKLGGLVIFTITFVIIASAISLQLFYAVPNLDHFHTFPQVIGRFSFASILPVLTYFRHSCLCFKSSLRRDGPILWWKFCEPLTTSLFLSSPYILLLIISSSLWQVVVIPLMRSQFWAIHECVTDYSDSPQSFRRGDSW